MEVDLQSFFGLHVTCFAQLYSLDLYTSALLVSKDRRHLFVTPYVYEVECRAPFCGSPNLWVGMNNDVKIQTFSFFGIPASKEWFMWMMTLHITEQPLDNHFPSSLCPYFHKVSRFFFNRRLKLSLIGFFKRILGWRDKASPTYVSPTECKVSDGPSFGWFIPWTIRPFVDAFLDVASMLDVSCDMTSRFVLG